MPDIHKRSLDELDLKIVEHFSKHPPNTSDGFLLGTISQIWKAGETQDPVGFLAFLLCLRQCMKSVQPYPILMYALMQKAESCEPGKAHIISAPQGDYLVFRSQEGKTGWRWYPPGEAANYTDTSEMVTL